MNGTSSSARFAERSLSVRGDGKLKGGQEGFMRKKAAPVVKISGVSGQTSPHPLGQLCAGQLVDVGGVPSSNN